MPAVFFETESARGTVALGDADEVVGGGLVLREHGDDGIDIAGRLGEGSIMQVMRNLLPS